ncbi:MAG: hypothetical protein KIT66_03770 [Chitinophagaceae bacterium]|nr:hypothetical protein [Chitinophagaceae bacterium]
MKKICIYTDNHHYNNLLRQWNKGASYAVNYEVSVKPASQCDFLIVLEYPKRSISCLVPRENIWVWSMEPPDEEWEWIRKCYKYFSRVITIDYQIKHPKFIHNQLAIPWQIGFSYDQLKGMDVFGNKVKLLSFVTSNYSARTGHKKRLKFLDFIKTRLNFDLYGRGFNEVLEKSVALLPYKYSIVVENSSYRDYWSEKLADAYLCGVLPFYYGCKNLEDYFDEKSFIRIDISKPEEAIRIIKSAIGSNQWEMRKAAIAESRRRIMDEYQFFPVMVNLIEKYGVKSDKREKVDIPILYHHISNIKPFSLHRIYYRLKKLFLKKKYNDPESSLFGYTTYK